MKKLEEMHFDIKMDRPITKDHYISPSGYSINGKQFDFDAYAGLVDRKVPSLLHCEVREFDGTINDKKNVFITPEDIKNGFDDFSLNTGSNNDPEINPVKVTSLTFGFYDEEKDEFTFISANLNILKGINKLLEEEFKEIDYDLE